MSTLRTNSARRRPGRYIKAEPLEIVHPNTFVWPERSRKNFVQLVALQCLLNPTPPRQPVQPVHQNADSREKRGGYRSMLPPKVERDLTEHFAFLVAAGAGDTACCVEEEYVIDVGSTLRFRVAMKEGVSQWILDGLLGVCSEVSKLARGESLEADVKAETWRRVLELERPRIHADLEERFSKASGSLSKLFEESLGTKDANTTETLVDEEARLVLRKIYDLCTRVVDMDREKTGKDLEKLLDTCYRFRASRNFRAFMKSVHSRRPLTKMIEKLARYKSASVALVTGAKKYPEMFTNLEVEAVPQLASEAAASMGFHGIYVGDVAQELTANSKQQCLKRLQSVTDLKDGKLEIRYQKLCQEKLTVHAEIQMVKFYEENPHIGRPAFIGCSKKACYLCTLFIQLEGKFDVATKTQSHYQPTLYNSWTVPTMKCSSPENAVMYTFVVDKMSRILEDSCRKILWENSSREAKLNNRLTPNFPLTPQLLGFEVPSGPSPSPVPASRIVSTLRASIPALPRMASSYNLSSGATTPTNIPLSPLSPTFFGNLPSRGLLSTPGSRVQSPGLILMTPPKLAGKQTPALDIPTTPVKPSNQAPEIPKITATPTITTLPAPVSAPSPRPRKHTPPPPPITPPAIETGFPLILSEPEIFTPDREPTPVVAPTRREPTPIKDQVFESEPTPPTPNSPGAETAEGSEDPFDLMVLPIQKHSPLVNSVESPSPTPSPPPKPMKKQTLPAKPTTPPPAPRPASGPAPLPSPPSSTGSLSKSWSSRVQTRETGLPPTPADSPTPSSGSYFPKSEPIRIKPAVNFSRPTCEFPPTPPTSCKATSSIPWPARMETVMATRPPASAIAPLTPPKSFAAMTSRPSTPANAPTRASSFRRRAISPPTQTHIPRPSSKPSTRPSPPPTTEYSSPVSSLRLVRKQTPPQTAAMAVSMAASIPRLSKLPSLRSSRRTPVSEARSEMVTSAIALEASRSRSTSAAAGTVPDNGVSSDSGQTSAGGVVLAHSPGTHASTSPATALRSEVTADGSILAQVIRKKSQVKPHPDTKLPFTAPETLSVLKDPRDNRGDSMEVHVAARNEDGESLSGSQRGSGAESTILEDSVQSSLRSPSKLIKFKPSAEKESEPSSTRRRYIEGENRGLKAVAVRSASSAESSGHPRPQGLGGVQRTSSRRKASPSSPSKLPTPSPPKDGSSFLNINGTHRSTRNKSGGVETKYTLYLANQNSQPGQPPLGEKLFTGKLSDRKGPGEIKQRVGCRLRTELRPREGRGAQGDKMRVREVAKSLEEMVLDIFFPDAILRLEVFWDV
ncbi:hypothetical protein C7212DRAFT_301426 [Tuber magnatum]|uniref:Uncharacterized protein n=1 Tax=Tuber magnatum TaxID=42249 RepID=A0A317SDJ3_9PEZI|nr:hypothetical protein C7212DRAFT_301426 [Tuber magnatum]